MRFYHQKMKKYVEIDEEKTYEIRKLQTKKKLMFWQAYDMLDKNQLKNYGI